MLSSGSGLLCLPLSHLDKFSGSGSVFLRDGATGGGGQAQTPRALAHRFLPFFGERKGARGCTKKCSILPDFGEQVNVARYPRYQDTLFIYVCCEASFIL